MAGVLPSRAAWTVRETAVAAHRIAGTSFRVQLGHDVSQTTGMDTDRSRGPVAPDLAGRARGVIEALERGDIEAVRARLSERAQDWDWSPQDWIVGFWRPRLDKLAGPDRVVSAVRRVNEVMARVVFSGARGQAFVTVLFDSVGKVNGFAIKEDDKDGGFGVVIACAADQVDQLRAFYALLVDAPLGFGEGAGRAPRWRDPNHPQQMHLDVVVRDLDAAETVVLGHAATKLEDGTGFRIYADPVGHPFCLYSDTSGLTSTTDRLGVLARVVIDCPDPRMLATFWAGLLDMRKRVEDSPTRVVVGREDGSLPMIGLQRVEHYSPPRWPDPDYPDQMHFDISFDDRPAKEHLAHELGATRLPPHGGSCPVYADPAGHPFCLCYTGE